MCPQVVDGRLRSFVPYGGKQPREGISAAMMLDDKLTQTVMQALELRRTHRADMGNARVQCFPQCHVAIPQEHDFGLNEQSADRLRPRHALMTPA